jgi:hypothetical protein
MLTYIAPNLAADLNNVPYPIHRVGMEGDFQRHAKDGSVEAVHFLLWADAMADPQGGYVVALHMVRPNEAEEQGGSAVHILGCGGGKRFDSLETAITRTAQIGTQLNAQDVKATQLIHLLRDRLLMIVVQPAPEEGIDVEVPPDRNIH